MANKSFLTAEAKKALTHYLAINGENFDGYSRFATQNGWRLYSKSTLHNWCQRHRTEIQLERAQHLFELRKTSLLDRNQRLQMLEATSTTLADRLDIALKANDDELVIKLSEQLRKQLQAVATERGEWNQPEDKNRGREDGLAAIVERMNKGLLAQGQTVDAESVVEVEVASPAVG